MVRRGCVLIACALALAACGDDDQTETRQPGSDTRLVVEVRPEGLGGPVERRVVTRPPSGLRADDFRPVRPDVACTQVYGGPATARVTGTLEGQPVDARFERTDGCEIARWDRVQGLLGRAPD